MSVNKFIDAITPSDHDKDVYEDQGQYFAWRHFGKKRVPVSISNFTFRVLASHYTQEGVKREIVMTNIAGKSTSRILIEAADMKSDSFETFCQYHGNFQWTGTKPDLQFIWREIFMHDEGKIIHEPDCVGWMPDKSIFLFGNVAFKGENILTPDQDGIFWHKDIGINPKPVSVTNGKSEISEGIPYLNTETHLDIDDLAQRLSGSIGHQNAMYCLSWCASSLYMEEVFAKFNSYPFLFIHGKRASGKSTIAEWLMALFGLEGGGKMASDTTSTALGRYLGYYSSLPVWVDEYRNEPKVMAKNGMMRNVYNRQSAGKATREGFGIREAKIRGTLIISGEETPTDNALYSRCITVSVTQADRVVNNFNWFMDNKRLLSNFTFQLLKDKPARVDQYLNWLMSSKEALSKAIQDDRGATNSAVIYAGNKLLFGEGATLNITDKALEDKTSQDEESQVVIMFEDLCALQFKGQLKDDYAHIADGMIYLYFHGLYNEWQKDFRLRRGENPLKEQSIRGYLRSESGFMEIGVNQRIKGKVCSCVVFDKDKAPTYIQQLIKEEV